MNWPTCGAAYDVVNCGKLATLVDACGVGFCEAHGDHSLTGELRVADSTDDFDPEWLADMQEEQPAFGDDGSTDAMERAAVVAWLRTQAAHPAYSYATIRNAAFTDAADAIEAGQHRIVEVKR